MSSFVFFFQLAFDLESWLYRLAPFLTFGLRKVKGVFGAVL